MEYLNFDEGYISFEVRTNLESSIDHHNTFKNIHLGGFCEMKVLNTKSRAYIGPDLFISESNYKRLVSLTLASTTTIVPFYPCEAVAVCTVTIGSTSPIYHQVTISRLRFLHIITR